MRPSGAAQRLLYWFSVALGLVLAIVPLPDWLGPLRPDLALLMVIYWILTRPRIAGLGYAWLAGLFLDVLRGLTIGQQLRDIPAGAAGLPRLLRRRQHQQRQQQQRRPDPEPFAASDRHHVTSARRASVL